MRRQTAARINPQIIILGKDAAAPQRGEGDVPRAASEHAEGQDQRQPAEAGKAEIDPRGAAVRLLLVLMDDEDPGGEGHRLEAEQQGEAVRGQQRDRHAGEEERVGDEAARRLRPMQAAQREDRGRGPRKPQDQQEPGRQRIDRDPRRPPGRKAGSGE